MDRCKTWRPLLSIHLLKTTWLLGSTWWFPFRHHASSLLLTASSCAASWVGVQFDTPFAYKQLIDARSPILCWAGKLVLQKLEIGKSEEQLYSFHMLPSCPQHCWKFVFRLQGSTWKMRGFVECDRSAETLPIASHLHPIEAPPSVVVVEPRYLGFKQCPNAAMIQSNSKGCAELGQLLSSSGLASTKTVHRKADAKWLFGSYIANMLEGIILRNQLPLHIAQLLWPSSSKTFPAFDQQYSLSAGQGSSLGFILIAEYASGASASTKKRGVWMLFWNYVFYLYFFVCFRLLSYKGKRKGKGKGT